ncbi:MAG: glycerol-3-phosphate acyltransferase [Acidimicrobiia bacterium]
MKLIRIAAFAVAGYLIGSVSFGRIVGKVVAPGQDMADTELELPGGAELTYRGVSATSVAVNTSPVWGIVTGVLDTAKAFIPTLVAARRWPEEPYQAAIATGVMVGHNYPLYHGFNGGRGQTPFYGSVLAMDPIAVPITNVAAVGIGVGLLREMLASYTLGMWLAIPWFAWRRRTPELVFSVIGNVLLTIRIIPEIKDYLELRRSGQIDKVDTWSGFVSSYPAMNKRDR